MSNVSIIEDFGDLEDASISDDDLIKILIATDIHLGYEESIKRKHQFDDSFNTFEEILEIAVENDVDMILLGGDLFHDTKPSPAAVKKCLQLIRKYCLGQKNIKLQFLSNPELVFSHCPTKQVNYEDLNINVKIPLFTVNGNHDDSVNGVVGSIDVISASGFVNYFGKSTDVNLVEFFPLVFRKGKSTVAIYGLSYMNEQILSRLFRNKKVTFYDLKDTEGLEDSYNIIVLHQNRVQHGTHQYIPENAFPDFMNLIVWGHEHECRVEPTPVTGKDYYICQPGSSVATSLCAGERELKHIALLQVCKKKFNFKKIRLQTVRPFIFEDIQLQEHELPTNIPRKKAVLDFVSNYIEHTVMPEAAKQLTGHPRQPLLPLIRLRIFHEKPEDVCDVNRLADMFAEDVANARQIIRWKKLRPETKRGGKKFLEIDDDDELWSGTMNLQADWHISVQERLEDYFNLEQNRDKLKVLSLKSLNLALTDYIEKDNLYSFNAALNLHKDNTLKYLAKFDLKTDEEIQEKVLTFRNICREQNEPTEELEKILAADAARAETRRAEANSDNESSYVSDEDVAEISIRGRGRGRGRGSGRGRNGKTQNDADMEIDDDADESPAPAKKGRGRGRGRVATSTRGRGRTITKNTIPAMFRGLKDFSDDF